MFCENCGGNIAELYYCNPNSREVFVVCRDCWVNLTSTMLLQIRPVAEPLVSPETEKIWQNLDTEFSSFTKRRPGRPFTRKDDNGKAAIESIERLVNRKNKKLLKEEGQKALKEVKKSKKLIKEVTRKGSDSVETVKGKTKNKNVKNSKSVGRKETKV